MKLPGITYQQVLELKQELDLRVIDVRSPQEFGLDHIPGAENVPLFNDDQRCMVGTLYAKESPEIAYQQGLVFAEQRLEGILLKVAGKPLGAETWNDKFQALKSQVTALQVEQISNERIETWKSADDRGKPWTVIHCWRGGMRSRALVALLRELGYARVLVLVNGYKSYRHWVLEQLNKIAPATPLVALRGPTGVGKTQILKKLEKLNPGSCIDLEACAGHRSSILGAVGLKPVSQKAFETNLVKRIQEMGELPWFVEGESRKVGNVVIPDNFYKSMETAKQVYVEASLEHRCKVLAEDYIATESNKSELRERLPFLEERLGAAWIGKLQPMLDAGNWRRVAEVLLKEYYDPLYGHSDRRRNWEFKLNAESANLLDKLESLRWLEHVRIYS